MAMNMENFIKLAEINEKIKALTKEAEIYKEGVKSDMLDSKLTEVEEGGSKFTLTISSRTTCSKKMDFMKYLAGKNLKHCLSAVYEPNYERAKDEIAAGNLTQAEYDRFVKETPVHTLKIK